MAEHIRYEPEEESPPVTTLVVGFQGTALIVSNTVMIASIFAAAFDDDGSYLEWALFAGLVVAGAVTALQASRFGRLGSGYVLMMGPGVPFLAVCVLAVHEGGLALMSSLVIASSLVQFAVGAWLAQLRRLITPVVAGVAFMMIAISAMPIAMERLNDVPAGASPGAGAAVAAATLGAAALLMLRGRGLWRLWALPIAIVAGCAVAVPLGVDRAPPAVGGRGGDALPVEAGRHARLPGGADPRLYAGGGVTVRSRAVPGAARAQWRDPPRTRYPGAGRRVQ